MLWSEECLHLPLRLNSPTLLILVHAHSTVSKVAETFQYPFVLLYLDIILYSDRQNYMDFLNSNLH